MSRVRKVGGILLKKTIGRNHHRWVTELSGQRVKFTAILGRHSGKPIAWSASPMYPESPLDDTRFDSYFHVRCASLTQCVKLADDEARRRMSVVRA